jgi:hypothetical protein
VTHDTENLRTKNQTKTQNTIEGSKLIKQRFKKKYKESMRQKVGSLKK